VRVWTPERTSIGSFSGGHRGVRAQSTGALGKAWGRELCGRKR
jgi:hypothetical protein